MAQHRVTPRSTDCCCRKVFRTTGRGPIGLDVSHKKHCHKILYGRNSKSNQYRVATKFDFACIDVETLLKILPFRGVVEWVAVLAEESECCQLCNTQTRANCAMEPTAVLERRVHEHLGCPSAIHPSRAGRESCVSLPRQRPSYGPG